MIQERKKSMSSVEMKKLVEKMKLKNLTPDISLAGRQIEVPDINRPALQLTGFFEHFDADRVQIIGYVEYAYLQNMSDERKEEIYSLLLERKIPCLIYSRDLKPDEIMLRKALEYKVPVFLSLIHI